MTRRGGGGQRQLDWSRPLRQGVDGRIRLERQESDKSASVSVTSSSMPVPPTIVVDDDDDDVHISSPRSFAQGFLDSCPPQGMEEGPCPGTRLSRCRARSAVTSSRQRSRTAESSTAVEHRASTEDLLTLRLGRGDFGQSTSARIGGTMHQITPKPRNRNGCIMVDLTRQSPPPSYDQDCILVNEFVQKKRKPAPVVSEPLPPEPVKELKLTCAICMDSMKEETSTICGHIFCKRCIHNAIQAQKKCPTCRQTLSQKQTHRIYISGSLRNP